MKTKMTVLAMIVCLMMVSAPAIAEDWMATLEKDILETHDVQQAMIRSEKAGVDKEDVLMAVLTIAQSNPDICAILHSICVEQGCCDGSPEGKCGGTLSGYCKNAPYKCCDYPPPSPS